MFSTKFCEGDIGKERIIDNVTHVPMPRPTIPDSPSKSND